jgi:hypothetical protein
MAENDTQAGLITIEAAAKLLMVSGQWVRDLQKAGHIPRGPRGKVSLVGAVQGYIGFLKQEERRTSKSAADSRVRDARATEIEQRIAERDRRLIPVEEAEAAVDSLAATVRSEFTGLPARAFRDLALRRQLETEVNGSFERVAEKLSALGGALRKGGVIPAADGDDGA